MKIILKLFSVLLLSTIVNASSSWIPIVMGDIITFVPSVSISPVANTYPVNATVSVNVNGTLSNNKDWIGIFKKGTQKKWGNQIAWNFVDGKSRVALTRNKLPMPAGEYEIALFFDNSLDKVESSVGFRVVGDANNDKAYPTETTFTYRATDTIIAEPTLNNPSVDNVFNTKISRLDTPDGTKTDYPKTQPWNSDMSLIRVDYKLYDAETLVESDLTKNKNGYAKLCSPGYDFKWSNVDPKAFYSVQTSGLFIKGRIDNDTIHCDNIIENFSDEYEIIRIGQGEGNIDINDKYVLFTVKKKNDDQMYILLYDIQSKTRVWTKEITGVKWKPNSIENDGDFDWATVSQSGKYILVNNVNKDNMTHGLSWYDINFNNHHYLQYEATDGSIESRGQHGDLGYDMNGDEVFVQFNYRQGGITMFNLDHPERLGTLVLNSVYGGGHVSCRNTKRPGWCYLTTNQEGYNEVFALKLDGSDNPTVQRFAQSHNPIMWYWDDNAQVYKSRLYWFTAGTPSPDGTKVLFNSRWNREHEKGTDYKTNVFMAESID